MNFYYEEDDWAYLCSDEELRGNSTYFVERHKFFNDKFKEYEITSYDTSVNREEILNEIILKY